MTFQSRFNYLIMKRHLFIRFFAVILFFIAFTAFMLPLVEGQKDFPAEKFSKVSIAVKSKVYIEQADNYKLDIQADDKTLEKISVEYNSDELQIKCKHGCKVDEPVIIYIASPSLNGISIAGLSQLFIEKSFETNDIELSIAGSGTMTLNNLKADNISASVAGSGKMSLNDLNANKVSADVAGSGNILLFGGKPGNAEDFSIAGSGNIDALGFEAADVKVEITGSGDCKVFASQKLNASVAGSGNVHYKGNPVVESETTGSGRVNHLTD